MQTDLRNIFVDVQKFITQILSSSLYEEQNRMKLMW